MQNQLVRGQCVATGAESAQVHILNTCAVTQTATKEAVRYVRRIKSRNPLALVVVTGCAAQVDTDQFSNLPGVDLVIANSHRSQLPQLILQHYAGQLRERVFKSNIFKKEELEPGGRTTAARTRAFLKIQDGCNSFCTFCVVPFARGKSRGLSIAQITEAARQLEEQGIKEVVLTGVHIGDYRDGQWQLEDLVESLLASTKIPRWRLSSLEPQEITPRLLALYRNSDSRLCPHFHVSVQSANAEVLRAMKRTYNAEAIAQCLQQLDGAFPKVFVSMDVIAGFPGESEAQFVDSMERLRSLPWTRLHVFPYSPRPGTVAARRPDQVPMTTVKRRAEILRQMSDERYWKSACTQIGSTKPALMLANGELLSRDYWTIQLTGEVVPPRRNQEVLVKIHAVHAQPVHLQGTVDATPLKEYKTKF